MPKKKDFEWRYQPPFDSDKAKMLSYIQNESLHPFQDKTMMIMAALKAYYMPLALYSEGSCSRENLELIFLDGVNAIANHLQYICTVIKIDPVIVGNVLFSGFGELKISNLRPEKQSIANIPSPLTDTQNSLDDFDPQMWNLAGITTDSETFET